MTELLAFDPQERVLVEPGLEGSLDARDIEQDLSRPGIFLGKVFGRVGRRQASLDDRKPKRKRPLMCSSITSTRSIRHRSPTLFQ
jgi:hypothetical protein